MAESWYVPVVVEYLPELSSHVFRAGVPDAVYDLPNAWDQEEVEFGLWILHFRDDILKPEHRTAMVQMGCKPVLDGKPEKALYVKDRADAIKSVVPEK